MNQLQNQVHSFLKFNFKKHESYENFRDKYRSFISDYNKDSHKLEILNEMNIYLKKEYDQHEEKCPHKGNCGESRLYQNILFFIQDDIEEIEKYLPKNEFSISDRQQYNEILFSLNNLKNGQEIIYDDLLKEILELKEMYFLNKKNWKEMFLGKMSEMIGSGIISETISKELIKVFNHNYDKIIS